MAQENPDLIVNFVEAQVAEYKRFDDIINRLGYAKDPAYFEICMEKQTDGNLAFFWFVSAGQDIGYGILNWEPKYGYYKAHNIPEIQDVNVLPEFRNQGAATAFIHMCEDMVLAKSHTHVGISVGVHESYGPAQRLYFKLGYGPDGYGITYDRKAVAFGEARPVDDHLCMMLVKRLGHSP